MAKSPKVTAEDEDRAAALVAIAARDEADIDGDEGPAEIDTSGADNTSADDVAPPAPAGLKFEDDPRADIAKSIAADRGKATPDEGDEPDDTGVIEAAPVAATAKDAANTPRKVRFDELDPETTVVVKVNGQDVTVKASDLVGGAQKWLAGDDYLKQGKEFYDTARRAPASQPADINARPVDPNQVGRRGASEAPDAAAGRPTPAERQAKLREIAVKLQTGTEEEATAALAELDRLTQPAEGAVTQGDVARLVGQAVASADIDRAAQAEANQALTDFATKHADLNKVEELGPSVFTAGFNQVVANLRAIGVPDEDFRSFGARDVIASYARLRQDPHYRDKLAPLTEVYDSVATKFEQRFQIAPSSDGAGKGQNQEEPASRPSVRQTESRVVRKQTVVHQPRPAAIRAQGIDPRSQTEERDASATIARMAQAREGTPLTR